MNRTPYLAALASLALGGCYAQADDKAAVPPTSGRSYVAVLETRVVVLEARLDRAEADIKFLLKHDEANARDIASISRDIGTLARKRE